MSRSYTLLSTQAPPWRVEGLLYFIYIGIYICQYSSVAENYSPTHIGQFPNHGTCRREALQGPQFVDSWPKKLKTSFRSMLWHPDVFNNLRHVYFIITVTSLYRW
jgi:hypothetical protein